MAQPLEQNKQPFCLAIFSTDNKFKTSHVLSRWKYIIKNLEAVGITVLGFSSDGDSRLLSSMKRTLELGILSGKSDFNSCIWYSSSNVAINTVQDTTHIGTKLRNRLLKPSIELPFGIYSISKTHLKELVTSCSKDVHQLTYTDIDPKDRQNFNSIMKICQVPVLNALKEHVPASNGTIMYLKICKWIIDSYMDSTLNPIERVYLIWKSVFILRGWRAWLIKEGYSLESCFISYNAYVCVEINAHSLINLIEHFRENNLSKFFLPPLFSSQPCESTFRQLRSMSSTYSTVVNTSMLEIMNRIKKIQLQGEITFSKNLKDVNFPRLKKELKIKTYDELPSNDEIIDIITKAKFDAAVELKYVEIDVSDGEIQFCKIKYFNPGKYNF